MTTDNEQSGEPNALEALENLLDEAGVGTSFFWEPDDEIFPLGEFAEAGVEEVDCWNPDWNPSEEYFVLLQPTKAKEIHFSFPIVNKRTLLLLQIIREFEDCQWIEDVQPGDLIFFVDRSVVAKGMRDRKFVSMLANAAAYGYCGKRSHSFYYFRFARKLFDQKALSEIIPLPAMDSLELANNLAYLQNSCHPIESDVFIFMFYGFGLVESNFTPNDVALMYWELDRWGDPEPE